MLENTKIMSAFFKKYIITISETPRLVFKIFTNIFTEHLSLFWPLWGVDIAVDLVYIDVLLEPLRAGVKRANKVFINKVKLDIGVSMMTMCVLGGCIHNA